MKTLYLVVKIWRSACIAKRDLLKIVSLPHMSCNCRFNKVASRYRFAHWLEVSPDTFTVVVVLVLLDVLIYLLDVFVVSPATYVSKTSIWHLFGRCTVYTIPTVFHVTWHYYAIHVRHVHCPFMVKVQWRLHSKLHCYSAGTLTHKCEMY